jgi:hypothetical protein
VAITHLPRVAACHRPVGTGCPRAAADGGAEATRCPSSYDPSSRRCLPCTRLKRADPTYPAWGDLFATRELRMGQGSAGKAVGIVCLGAGTCALTRHRRSIGRWCGIPPLG